MPRISSVCVSMACFLFWNRPGIGKLLPTSGPPLNFSQPTRERAFTFLNGWGKKKSRGKWKIQVALFINKVLLERFYTQSFMYHQWLLLNFKDRIVFLWQRPSGLKKLDIFTVWPLPTPGLDNLEKRKKKRRLMCESCSSVFGSHHRRARCVTWGPPECWQCWGSRRSYFGGIKLQLILLRVYCVNWRKVAKRMMAERTMSRALLRTEYNVEPSAPPCLQLWHGGSEGESPDACL